MPISILTNKINPTATCKNDANELKIESNTLYEILKENLQIQSYHILPLEESTHLLSRNLWS